MSPSTHDNEMVVARVRHNAGSAGIAAVCLLLFGFGMFTPPKVTDLFTFGDFLFNYTLRIGGIAMAGIALWSTSGRPVVLLVDAVCSTLIGAGLVISGAALIAGGGGFGMNYVLYVVFGVMFVMAGIRNGGDYAYVRSLTDESDPHRVRSALEDELAAAPATPLGSQLRERRAGLRGEPPAEPDPVRTATPPAPEHSHTSKPVPADTDAPPLRQAPTQPISQPMPEQASPEQAADASAEDEPAPDGFLASFADREDKPEP